MVIQRRSKWLEQPDEAIKAKDELRQYLDGLHNVYSVLIEEQARIPIENPKDRREFIKGFGTDKAIRDGITSLDLIGLLKKAARLDAHIPMPERSGFDRNIKPHWDALNEAGITHVPRSVVVIARHLKMKNPRAAKEIGRLFTHPLVSDILVRDVTKKNEGALLTEDTIKSLWYVAGAMPLMRARRPSGRIRLGG